MKVKITQATTFQRYEKKYLLTERQYQELTEALKRYMTIDEYGLHTICSLYYDTEDYAVIRRCLERPSFKQKLRLRSYGIPDQEQTVYLELKKKLAGITYKRRMPLSLWEAAAYMEQNRQPAERDQVFREIEWYQQQQPLAGKAVICYDRIALMGGQDPELRVTFDSEIRWRSEGLDLNKGDHGALLLPPKIRLMEIKTMNALPLWLSRLLSAQQIYPASFSKYGTVYQQHLVRKAVMPLAS